MSSGGYKRHDGFNKWQIKNGFIVLMTKDGRIARTIEKYKPKIKRSA